MRHLAAFVGAVVLAALGAGASAAAQAQQIHISINDTVVSDFWSKQCGFTVTINVTADLQVTLVRNQEGLIVREIDRAGGGRITFSSDNGSFSFPAALSIFDYGSGAVIGSSVVVLFPGLQGHVPGLIASDAGLAKLEGVVVTGFDEFGIPELDFSNADLVLDVGNRESLDNIRAAICGALSGA